MNIEELRQDPSFNQLTDKQKTFIEAYIRLNGDKIAAAKEAYECKNDRTARSIAYQQLRHFSVMVLISKYHGDGVVTRDQFVTFLWKEINRKTDLRYKAPIINLFSELCGFTKDKKSPEAGQPQDSSSNKAEFLAKYED